MSSRALRRLQQEEDVIRVGVLGASASSEEESNQPGFTSAVRSKKKNKSASSNPFAAVSVLGGCTFRAFSVFRRSCECVLVVLHG